jgi:hypothetical protein
MGSTLSAPTLAALVTACDKKTDQKAVAGKFTPGLEKLLDEAAETIIPETSTPGAKAAGVGPWIVMMMNECYPEKDRAHFMEGINSLDQSAEKAYKKSFVELGASERTEILKGVEAEAIADREKQKAEADEKKKQNTNAADSGVEAETPMPHFFLTLKELTLLGYFTSEAGTTKALDYVPVPGRYEGCTDMKPGQKAWA